ncbi:Abi family protein [Pseudoclavibacter terrae]|uniref:Abi family protein n=1 Tax=Pseudoclavibacter terrae TaxID=1530195 RepID=A0A7J5AYD5_9MICO|nr:Abi family protein [Pseudoclavibacter terrae]KAB1636071.1 hypothetical protein F8O03_17585 [Pseudoclavibacter terrae]
MTSQPLGDLLGAARLATYMNAATGDAQRALDLYLWATELSGALHAQLSFVEVAVRNAIDPQLASWNVTQNKGSDWTAPGQAAQLLYDVVGKPLSQARDFASKEANSRGPHHTRAAHGVTHDDVLAQLMFGTWVKIITPISRTESSTKQIQLWSAAVHRAFPNTGADDASRVAVGQQLETLRRLRNRVAHHDNLLHIQPARRFNDMLSLLAKIDRSYPAIAAARSSLRRLQKEDPRKSW